MILLISLVVWCLSFLCDWKFHEGKSIWTVLLRFKGVCPAYAWEKGDVARTEKLKPSLQNFWSKEKEGKVREMKNGGKQNNCIF